MVGDYYILVMVLCLPTPSFIKLRSCLAEFLEQIFDPSRLEYIEEPFNVTRIDESVLVSMTVDYSEGDTQLQGFVSYSNTSTEKRGVLVIVPDWDGIDDYERWRANLAAMAGYVGGYMDAGYGSTGA